jgi:hypothetical protein
VVNHEHFREICAAASIGQATAEELLAFEQHAQECKGCQQIYFDYLNLAAEQFAAANGKSHFSISDVSDLTSPEVSERRFFERAQADGLRFSPDSWPEGRRSSSIAQLAPGQVPRRIGTMGVTALLIFVLGLAAGYFGGSRSAKRILGTQEASRRHAEGALRDLGRQAQDLTASNEELRAEVSRLSANLTQSSKRMRTIETDLYSTAEDRKKLQRDQTELAAQLNAAQKSLAQSQLLVVNTQKEAAKDFERASTMEAMLAAQKVKISDLAAELDTKSAEVDREQQLLALSHDVSDLMGARNLHIVDVVDTDPRGKTRPVFGRIFFTEGKSLVFYAYDLNEAKIQKANYQYRVWAKQEGSEKQIRSLGIFYSDDKSQRRWVFKCNDPKILAVIDSVFVTLEPAGADSSRPKGPNLMYAYLWGQPNHP